MPIKGLRWVWVATAAAVTLAVLSLSYSSYESLGVKKPLVRAVLSNSDVMTADVRKDGATLVIQIGLKKVPDLARSYDALDRTVREHLGSSPYRIEIVDLPTPRLEEAYHAVHFYVEEASVRGTFGAMMEESSRVLDEAGIPEYKLTVDTKRIYVQIAGEGGYLYRVIERPSRVEEGMGA